MSSIRTVLASAAAAALLTGAVAAPAAAHTAAPGAAPAPAAVMPEPITDTSVEGLWLFAYAGGAIVDVSVDEDGQLLLAPLTYDEWAAAGFPTYRTVTTQYWQLPWSPTITAVSWLGDDPETAPYYPEALSYELWASLGFPEPTVADSYPSAGLLQWATSPEIFIFDLGFVYKLSYQEWADAGFPGYETAANMGAQKLSWDPSIAVMTDIEAGQGAPISYEEWSALAMPTPQVVDSFPGETVYMKAGDSTTIWYAGPTVNRPLTFAEWTALGRPAPVQM